MASTVSDVCVCITLQSYYSPGDFLLSLKPFWGCLMCCFFWGFFEWEFFMQENPCKVILVQISFWIHGLNSCMEWREFSAFMEVCSHRLIWFPQASTVVLLKEKDKLL